MKSVLKRIASVSLAFLLLLSCFAFLDNMTIKSKAQAPVNPNSNYQVKNIINYLNECTYSGKIVSGGFDYNQYADPKAADLYDSVEATYGVSLGIYNTYIARNTSVVEDSYDIDRLDCPLTDEYIKQNGWEEDYKPYGFSDTYANHAFEDLKTHYQEGAICFFHFPSYANDDNHANQVADGEDPLLTLRNYDKEYAMQFKDDPTSYQWQSYQQHLYYMWQAGNFLEKLQNAGITVMFRPFTEMNNPQFLTYYAATSEGRKHFQNIYKQFYDYIVNVRKINNVVWLFSNIISDPNWVEYYPGDDYVDVIAPTSYPNGATGSDSISSKLGNDVYSTYKNLTKPLGYAEFGLSEDEDGELGDYSTVIPALKKYLPNVCFISTWCNQNGLLSSTATNVDKFLNDPVIQNLEDLPDYQNPNYSSSSGVLAICSQTSYGGTLNVLDVGTYSSAALKAKGLTASSYKSLRLNEGYAITFYTEENCKGTSRRFIGDVIDLTKTGFDWSRVKSVKVEKVNVENATLKKPVICNDPDSDPTLINDGTLEFWESYKCNPTAWVVIDLKDVYTISRWEVQNVGAYGELEDANTTSYKLQYSIDGKKWTDLDSVFGNVASGTSASTWQVDAQYVRLYITDPNSSNFDMDMVRVAICEFSVYGVKKSAGITTNWDLVDLTGGFENNSTYMDTELDGADEQTVKVNEVTETTIKTVTNTQRPIIAIIIAISVTAAIIIAIAVATIIILKKKKKSV